MSGRSNSQFVSKWSLNLRASLQIAPQVWLGVPWRMFPGLESRSWIWPMVSMGKMGAWCLRSHTKSVGFVGLRLKSNVSQKELEDLRQVTKHMGFREDVEGTLTIDFKQTVPVHHSAKCLRLDQTPKSNLFPGQLVAPSTDGVIIFKAVTSPTFWSSRFQPAILRPSLPGNPSIFRPPEPIWHSIFPSMFHQSTNQRFVKPYDPGSKNGGTYTVPHTALT